MLHQKRADYPRDNRLFFDEKRVKMVKILRGPKILLARIMTNKFKNITACFQHIYDLSKVLTPFFFD